MEADSAELSDVFKVTCPVTTHWESHSVLGISSESKLTSTHVHSISHSPLSWGVWFPFPRNWDCSFHPQELCRRPAGLDTAVGGLQIKLQDKSRKELVNFLITSETPCLGPCCSFSLETPFFLFSDPAFLCPCCLLSFLTHHTIL